MKKKRKKFAKIKLTRQKKGVTLLEILIGIVLVSIVSLFTYSIFSAQIRLFLTQTTGIHVSSQNKIALDELTNQARQAQSIVASCPLVPACSGEVGTSTSAVVYKFLGLDGSGNPTNAYYDYIVFKQSGTNLQRITYKAPSSTRASGSKIIATDLKSIADGGGLSFTYNNADLTLANAVTFKVTTTKTESNKNQIISQAGTAKLRNSNPRITFESSSGSAGVPWNHTISSSKELLLVYIWVQSSSGTPSISSVTPPSYTVGGTTQTLSLENSVQSVVPFSNYKTFLYYLTDPTVGFGTIAVTYTNMITARAVSTSWQNVNVSSPFDGTQSSTGDAASPLTINTSSSPNGLIVDNMYITNSGGSTCSGLNVGPGEIQRFGDLSNSGLEVFQKDSSGSSTTTSWNWSIGPTCFWLDITASLKPLQ